MDVQPKRIRYANKVTSDPDIYSTMFAAHMYYLDIRDSELRPETAERIGELYFHPQPHFDKLHRLMEIIGIRCPELKEWEEFRFTLVFIRQFNRDPLSFI